MNSTTSNRSDRRLAALSLLLPLILVPSPSPSQAEEYRFDVVVFGATPGGVAAAVGAAREGVRVALVEPTDHIGGVMTGGLSFSDSNQTDRRTLKGLFEEIHLRIERDYQDRGVQLPYRVAEKLDLAHWTYEPHVAARIFANLLDEAGVRVFPSQRLVDVSKEDARIQTLKTRTDTFIGHVFIDATYEGDLIAAAGVTWKLGREGRAEFDESLAGRQYPKPPATGFNPKDEDGRPLPLVTADHKDDDDEAGDDRVMTYSFRLCLTKNESNRVPLERPVDYDPAAFELVRRFIQANPPKHLLIDLYPLPGDKFDGNNSIGGQFGIGLVGGCNSWCEATYEERERIWKAHRDYTEGLLWFMATDPAMPEHLRTEMQQFGYPRDEFVDRGHFPPALYIREGRRMVGQYVLTQHDVVTNHEKTDPIAVSSFPIDSHDVQRIALENGFLNEGTIFPVRVPSHGRIGYAYQIPYRAITPKREECENLLAPVPISSTHVAYSSIRVEPTWITIGQSSGIAAALAAQTERPVQDAFYPHLRERLLAQGLALDLLPPPPPPTAVGKQP